MYKHPWAPAGMGQGKFAPPPTSWKCFLLQMLSKTFMHHFEKMSSASGGFAPRSPRGAAPGPCWGTPSFWPRHCPPLEKSCGRPCKLHHLMQLRTCM